MPKYTPRMVKVKTKQNKVEVKQISLVVEQLQLSCTAGREQKSVELLWNCSAISTKDEHIKINNFTSK